VSGTEGKNLLPGFFSERLQKGSCRKMTWTIAYPSY
jgi:hypothetical protein